MSYSWERIEKKQMNPKTVDRVCMRLFLNGFVKSPGWRIFFFLKLCPCVNHCKYSLCPRRGHQNCQLLIFLKATKHTPVNICECLGVFVCAYICVCLYWCRAAQGAFSTKQIAVGAVWSVVISRREAETLKVTTVAPLMPVNVTEARTQSFSLNLCACLWKLSIQRHS